MFNIRMGLKTKLMLSFGLVLGTAIVASSIALFTYSRFAESFSNIADKSVPFMAASMELTRLAMHVSAVTPLLVNSKNSEEVFIHHATIIETLEEVNMHLEQASESDALAMEQGKEQVVELHTLVNQLETLVDRRISNVEGILKSKDLVKNLYGDINQQLLDVIDTETFDFVINSEDLFGESGVLIDSLLNENIDSMVSALKLEIDVNKLAMLRMNFDTQLSETEREKTEDKVLQLRASIATERDKLSQHEPDRMQSIAESIEYVSGVSTASANDLFLSNYIYSGALVEETQLSKHEASISNVLSEIVAERFNETQITGETLTESLTSALPGMMSDGIDSLLRLLVPKARAVAFISV